MSGPLHPPIEDYDGLEFVATFDGVDVYYLSDGPAYLFRTAHPLYDGFVCNGTYLPNSKYETEIVWWCGPGLKSQPLIDFITAHHNLTS